MQPQILYLDGKAVPEDIGVQILKILLVRVLGDKILHSLLPRDKGGGGHIVHRFQLALQGFGLLLRIGVVDKGQNFVFALHLLEIGVGIDRHQREGSHNQQAGHGDANGGKGHEAVAEHIGKALMEKVAEIVLTHGYALLHSRPRCR